MDIVTCRKATTNDVEGIAHCQIKTWQSAYKGIVDQDYLDQQAETLEERIARWTRRVNRTDRGTFVAIVKDEVVGFSSTGLLRDAQKNLVGDTDKGELYALYIDPDFKRQGIGMKLFQSSVLWARNQQMQDFYVWVLKDNHNARSFYETAYGTTKQDMVSETEIGDQWLKEIRYHWKIG